MLYRRNLITRQGFTLIELLVVIAILGVLTALAFTGFSALMRTANTRKTKVALSNAASMLAEYDASNSFKQQPPYMWSDAVTPAKVMADFNIWRDAKPPYPPPAADGEDAMKAPRGSMDADAESEHGQRLEGQAVCNTAVVLRELSKMPGVKKMLSQVPADALFKIPNEPGSSVMLDAWGNPIIFVPASGLSGVYLGDKSDTPAPKPMLVTSVRTVDPATLPVPAVVVSGARPFFASAGPDGTFDYLDIDGNNAFTPGTDIPAGNDNLYSFEN